RSLSPRVLLLIGLASSLILRQVECATVPEPGDLRAAGKVEFPISCTPAVQSEFSRGVALLHSFFYEEARRVFTFVAERDPKCATSIRTISKSRLSTLSRSWLQVMPCLMTRLYRNSSRQPPSLKSCGNKTQIIQVSFIT